MVYRCKNCGAALEYSVEQNMMVCGYCKSTFSVEEVSDSSFSENSVSFNGDYNNAAEENGINEENEKQDQREHAYVKMQIMRCTSCGAELAVNGVETSTFCAYCGQATVIQDRVDDYLKPDYIIPFKITRNDAERIIRAHLNKGFFVPKKIKKFEVEKIRGIYIPFWLFDMKFKDSQYWAYKVRSGKRTETRYEYFEAKTFFEKLTLDASLNLNDDSSVRLEPYDMRQLKEFDTAYLSGYYSDRFDVGVADITENAALRAGELFNEGAKEELRHKEAKLVKTVPEYEVTKTEYALLPAWFLTFRCDDKPFTILVNGQTGKVIGAVPYAKLKVYTVFSIAALILCPIFIAIFIALSVFFFELCGFDSKSGMKLNVYYLITIPIGLLSVSGKAISKFRDLKKSLSLTTANKINKYAKERQDR